MTSSALMLMHSFQATITGEIVKHGRQVERCAPQQASIAIMQTGKRDASSILAYGHEVRLMSPEYVQPYVKAQKNDERDAEAIAEAATRPTMRFVELKSESQLDVQTLHRARSRLVGERTALINQLRALLLERGITVAQGRRRLEHYLELVLDSDDTSTVVA
jgi:transposase